MFRKKGLLLVLGLTAILSMSVAAQVDWVVPYVGTADTTFVSFSNTTGVAVNVLHLEFDQEVTITEYIPFQGSMVLLGEATGTTFDFVGELIPYGEMFVKWQPVGASIVFGQWLQGEAPVGQTLIGSIAVLGRLFGQGIVAAREANPDALNAAFQTFFLENGEYLAGLSASLGMSLAEALMPVILEAPAAGIENFFNTIVGMLGVTSLEEVIGGDLDFGALFALLGL